MAIDTPARIAILGAGPIGLEAALYARYLGYDVDLYERGKACEALCSLGSRPDVHPVRSDRLALGPGGPQGARPRLAAAGRRRAAHRARVGRAVSTCRWPTPICWPTACTSRPGSWPSGARDFCRASWLATRRGATTTFACSLESTLADDHGRQRFATADAVIDATGTFGNSNCLGPGGLPAIGELAAGAHFELGLPDVLSARREHFAGRNTLVVGDGCSAATNLIALAALASQVADTWVTWVTRGPDTPPITPRSGDPFAERVRIVEQANRLAIDDANHVTHLGGTTVEAISWHHGPRAVHGAVGRQACGRSRV